MNLKNIPYVTDVMVCSKIGMLIHVQQQVSQVTNVNHNVAKGIRGKGKEGGRAKFVRIPSS